LPSHEQGTLGHHILFIGNHLPMFDPKSSALCARSPFRRKTHSVVNNPKNAASTYHLHQSALPPQDPLGREQPEEGRQHVPLVPEPVVFALAQGLFGGSEGGGEGIEIPEFHDAAVGLARGASRGACLVVHLLRFPEMVDQIFEIRRLDLMGRAAQGIGEGPTGHGFLEKIPGCPGILPENRLDRLG